MLKLNVWMISFLGLVLNQVALAQYKPTTSTSHYEVTYVVKDDGSYSETTELMTKVDTQQGIERAGQDRISYIASLSKVEVVEAYTLLKNGQKVVVKPESIMTLAGAGSSSAPMFSDAKVKVITYSQVEEGGHAYYKSKSAHHTPVFPGHFYARFVFSPHEVFEKVVINLVHSESLKVDIHADRVQGGKIASAPGDPVGSIRYQYSFSQTLAYPTEMSQLSYVDFAPSITFSTMKDYQALAKAYYSRAKPAANPTPDIDALAHDLVQGVNSEREKVKRIFEWVQKNIRYVAIYAGDGGYVPHSVQSVFDNRYGDCKDHSVILESLLRSVGIASTPALINSGGSFSLPKPAVPTAFDHVITYVPSLDLYLDSTDEFARIGLLPFSDMNKSVLHVATGIIATTPVARPDADYTLTLVKLALQSDGSMTGTSYTKPHGAFEVASRRINHDRVHEDPDSIVDQLLARNRETGSGRITTPQAQELDSEWFQRAEFKLDEVVNLPGPSALSIPLGIARGDLMNWSKMIIPETRRFPSTCRSTRHIEEYEMSFPPNAKVVSVPKGVKFHKGSIKYQSAYRLTDGRLTVRREMVDLQTSPVCAADDDGVWGEFAPLLRRDLRAQVILK